MKWQREATESSRRVQLTESAFTGRLGAWSDECRASTSAMHAVDPVRRVFSLPRYVRKNLINWALNTKNINANIWARDWKWMIGSCDKEYGDDGWHQGRLERKASSAWRKLSAKSFPAAIREKTSARKGKCFRRQRAQGIVNIRES